MTARLWIIVAGLAFAAVWLMMVLPLVIAMPVGLLIGGVGGCALDSYVSGHRRARRLAAAPGSRFEQAYLRKLEEAIVSHEVAVNRGENRAVADWLIRNGAEGLDLDKRGLMRLTGMYVDDPGSDPVVAEQLIAMCQSFIDRDEVRAKVEARRKQLAAGWAKVEAGRKQLAARPSGITQIKFIPLEPKATGRKPYPGAAYPLADRPAMDVCRCWTCTRSGTVAIEHDGVRLTLGDGWTEITEFGMFERSHIRTRPWVVPDDITMIELADGSYKWRGTDTEYRGCEFCGDWTPVGQDHECRGRY